MVHAQKDKMMGKFLKSDDDMAYDAWAAAEDAQRDAAAMERKFERTGSPYDYEDMVAAQARAAEAEELFGDAVRSGRR